MVEEKVIDLAGRKLFIGIPAYDGKVSIKLAYTIAQLMPLALRHGISVKLGHVSGCSIITMARNMLVDEFLKTDCTELLFIDADVIAEPHHILRLLAQSLDKDITAGAYPRRKRDKMFFMDLHYDDKGDLEFEGSMMRINRVGTGFMLIKRHVIEHVASEAKKYVGQDGESLVAGVFEFSYQGDKFVGEDYTFCDKASELGYKVWIDVEISLPHVGTEEFTNDFKNEVVVPLLEETRKNKLKVVNG